MLEIVVNATLQLQTMRRVVVIKVSQYDHEMPQSDITDNPHIGVEETQKTNSHMVSGRLFEVFNNAGNSSKCDTSAANHAQSGCHKSKSV